MESQKFKSWTKMVLYISHLRFPNVPAYYFPFYMLIIYNQIQKLYKTKTVPLELLSKIIEFNRAILVEDGNNCVVINESTPIEGVFVQITDGKNLKRLSNVIKSTEVENNVVIINDVLSYNLNKTENTLNLKVHPVNPKHIKIASEISLSLINTPQDASQALVASMIKNYFSSPKIICENDLIAINVDKYAPEYFYTCGKANCLETVYFKCLKVYDNGSNETRNCRFAVIRKTVIKQSANIQGFVPPILKALRHFEDCSEFSLVNLCPCGLEGSFGDLKKAVQPFLIKSKLQLKPTFLLQGNKGSGKNKIVSSLASKLGLHLYVATSADFTSFTYAQMEIKLRNVFFKAKLCSPCILAIRNFENFGKNNEGQYDERIINFFKTELENNLFKNNSFPLILICISNVKDIPPELSRVFLEIFEVTCPGENQRLQMLNWILNSQFVDANVEDVARKTHGFLFEDLKALVFFARNNSASGVLSVSDFERALDHMQSQYNQSLGAPKIPKVQWKDVGGLSDVKSEIIKTINLPLRYPELLRRTGLKRSGVLLYGPPGTGKTLIAKAVATECNLCFLSVKGPELLNMYVGQSEQNVRDVFERAREASPCIIFFDELDSLAPNRGISGDSGGVMDRVVSQLLAEMDGLDQSATIFVIGATNRPDLIDPALLRPGRFDKLLYVGPCTDPESKVDVLKALTRKFRLDEGVMLEEIIRSCPKNVTGADLYGLCSNAWLSAVRKLIYKIEIGGLKELTEEAVVVGMDDFLQAVIDLKPSIKKEDLLYFENLQRQLGVAKK